jgi:hypothetical protein
MESLGDKVNQIQLLSIMLILTAIVCQTPTVHGYNSLWESSDLIIEGTIIEIKIQEGEPLGTGIVNRVIKTGESTSVYTKGLELGSQVTIRSPEIEEDQYQRMYLKEINENQFRVIKVEPIPEPEPPLDYGSIGYLSLILVTVSAYYLGKKVP